MAHPLQFLNDNHMYLYNSSRFAGSSFEQQGKYTEAELNDMIVNQSYIPIASADEFDSIRTSTTREMGVGSPWKGNYVTGLDKKYVQVFSIDLSSYVNFNGFSSFSGIYDGNEVNISNLTMEYLGSNYGLFAASSNKLYNIRLYGGINQTAAGATYIGLLCGINSGTIENCIVDGYAISSGVGLGIICGLNQLGGIITNCYSLGSSSGVSDTGGFVGINNGTIQLCGSSANVQASSTYAGGFMGRNANTGIVQQCSCIGSVSQTGSNSVGGFAGGNLGIIENCYSRGNVTGLNYIGGFVGYFPTGSIINSYSTGSVNSLGLFGGFAAQSSGTATSNYYDTDTSGQSDTKGATGKTTTEMQQGLIPDTTIYIGWSNLIWQANSNSEYPSLIGT